MLLKKSSAERKRRKKTYKWRMKRAFSWDGMQDNKAWVAKTWIFNVRVSAFTARRDLQTSLLHLSTVPPRLCTQSKNTSVEPSWRRFAQPSLHIHYFTLLAGISGSLFQTAGVGVVRSSDGYKAEKKKKKTTTADQIKPECPFELHTRF